MKKILLLAIAIVIIVVITGGFLAQRFPIINQANNNLNINNLLPSGKILDLSNQGLKSIPSSVFSQTGLEELDISNNLLTGAIQAEIRHLTNLKVLNASNNSMTGVPAEIGQLKKLEFLDLSNNQLTGLPYELGNLSNLKVLNLSGNKYSQQDLNYIRNNLPTTVKIILN